MTDEEPSYSLSWSRRSSLTFSPSNAVTTSDLGVSQFVCALSLGSARCPCDATRDLLCSSSLSVSS